MAILNKISPLLPAGKQETKSAAPSKDIIKRVISGSVTVRLLPWQIVHKSGITDPREAITFPYLVIEIVVFREFLDFAITTFSIMAFDTLAFIG